MVFCIYAFPFTQRSSCTQSHAIWVIAKALLIGGNGISWVGVLVKRKAVIGGRSEWGCWVKLGDESCWMLFMTSHGGLKINTSEWVGVCAWIYPGIFRQICPTRCNRIPDAQLKTAQFYSKNIADNDQELMMLSCQPCLKISSIIIHISL